MTSTETRSTSLYVVGLDCADCARTLESALAEMPGVNSCSVQFTTGRVSIDHDSIRTEGEIADQVNRLGYRVSRPQSTPTRMAFDISGMDCVDCANTLSVAVRELPGVADANVDFVTGRLVIDAPERTVSAGEVADVAGRLGFRTRPVGDSQIDARSGRRMSRRSLELSVAALLSGTAIVLTTTTNLHVLPPVMHIAATVLAGYPVARAAVTSVRVRRADMNLLMTIAAVGALLLRDWAEASTLMILFGVGLALQSASIDRTRGAIRNLLQIAPTSARVRRGTGFEAIPISNVVAGDEVDVQPGDRIPVDGLVLIGTSSVNQAAITGESVPIQVEPGSDVLAGSVNGDFRLTVRSTSSGTDNTVSRIIALVENAHATKAPAQTLVERFAAIYTPIVLIGAILLAVLGTAFSGGGTEWIYRALVLLVVACPCALVISTPVAFVSALGRASKLGVLFKGGLAVESLAKVRHVSFDKTGTITHGRPDVTVVVPVAGESVERVLAIAAGLESGTSHPIGRGIVRAASEIELAQVSDISVVSGRGLRGSLDGQPVSIGSAAHFRAIPAELMAVADQVSTRGETPTFVGIGDRVIGVIGVADTIRPVSESVVARLRTLGIRTQLLTGDTAAVAAVIGTAAGIDDVRAGLSPADKVAAVVEAQQTSPVVMIGDGINDAPALATADVGIAMGAGGSAAAIEAADVALMSDDLTQLPRAISLARSTRAVILQNIVFAIVTKVAFVGLTATGYTSLWLAVVADVGASLIVTFNALRLMQVDLE